MKIIYLAAFKAFYPNYNIIYQEAEKVSNIKFLSQSNRQGGKNVHYVIEQFLDLVYGN